MQWSYWLGWTLGLGINAVLAGDYLRQRLLPGSSTWGVWLIAVAVLGLSVAVNHRGITPGARVQAALLACTAVVLFFLLVVPLLSGDLQFAHLVPFRPPGGWAFSAHAGCPGRSVLHRRLERVRGGDRGWRTPASTGAVSATPYVPLLVVAGVIVAVYSLVPVLMLATVEPDSSPGDLSNSSNHCPVHPGWAGSVLVPVALMGTFFLALNTIAIGSSRTLSQMARNGEAWPVLGRLNRHGAPGNALLFDLVFNATVLAVSFLINEDRAEVPIAVLASANVGYFACLILALVAAWLMRRTAPATADLPCPSWRHRLRSAPRRVQHDLLAGRSRRGLGRGTTSLSGSLFSWPMSSC